MEKTTPEKLAEVITNEYKIDDKKPDTHTKIYTIHTILYAIVAVRLQLFDDTTIDKFVNSYLINDNVNNNFNFIKTLLKKSTAEFAINYDTDDAAKKVAKNVAKKVAVSSVASYAMESAESACKNGTDDDIDDDMKRIAKRAKNVANDLVNTAKNVSDSVNYLVHPTKYVTPYLVHTVEDISFCASFATKNVAATDAACNIAKSANKINDDENYILLYLISAYLYLSIE